MTSSNSQKTLNPEQNPLFLSARNYRIFLILLFCAILGYLGLTFWVGWEEMRQAIIKIDVSGLLIALSLTLLSLSIRFARWQWYLYILNIHVHWFSSLRIYIGGLALTATPGKAGELIRSIFLKRYHVNYTKSFAIFFSDRFTDLVAVLLLAAIGIWANEAARPVAIFLVIAVITVLFMIRYPQIYTRFTEVLAPLLPGQKLAELLRRSANIIDHCRELFQWPVFLGCITLSALAWTLEAVNLFMIVILLGAKIGFATILFIYAFSKLVGAISMIPGGLGSTEATLIALLIINNVDETTAISCAIFLRLTTFWFVCSLGALAMPRR